MKAFHVCIVLAFLMSPASAVAADQPVIRTSVPFNAGWRFARFGPMADGSTRAEPGGGAVEHHAQGLERGGREGEHGGACLRRRSRRHGGAPRGRAGRVAHARPGSELPVEAIEVDWEFPDSAYEYAVEWSNEGQAWNRLAIGHQPGCLETGQAPAKLAAAARPRRSSCPRASGPASARSGCSTARRPADQEHAGSRRQGTAGRRRFDDSAWRTLDVPHDWGIEGPFRDDLPGDTGKLPWKGIGWYRKHFNVPASDQGKRVFIDFDGAMANARVWLNGQDVGGWPYGYQPFRLELTPHVKFGAENVLAVRLDTVALGLAVVSRRGALSQRLAGEDQPRPRGPLGRVRDDAVAHRREGRGPGLPSRSRTRAATTPTSRFRPEILEFGDGVRRSIGRQLTARQVHGRGRGRRARSQLDADGAQSQALGPGRAEPLPGANDRPSGRARSSTSTTSPSASAPSSSPRATASSSTAARPFYGHLQPSRSRPAGRRAQRPGPGAAARDPQGDGLQRAADLAQSPRAGAAGPGRPDGLRRDGRGVRLLEAGQDRRRLQPALRRVAREGPAGHGPARAEPSQRDHVEHRQRDRRAERAGAGEAASRHRPRRGPDPARHGGLQQRQRRHERVPDRGGRLRAQLQPGRLRADPRPSAATSRSRCYTSESSSCVSSRGEYFFPVKRGRDSQANFQVSSYDVDAPPWAQPPDEVFEALDQQPGVLRRVRLDRLRLPRRADAVQLGRRRTCSTSPTPRSGPR